MNIQLILGFIPLALLLLVFLVAGFISRRRSHPASAPKGNKVTRITETTILFSSGLIAFIYFGCFNNGLLLHLGRFRPAFATTHIIIAGIVIVFLLLAALLSWIGRVSWAVVLTIVVLFGYSTIIKQAAFNGPGYFMTLLAPENSWEPMVNYTFEVNDGLEGAEIWINGVFVGKTPFEMTGREFHKKVPFLTEPPEGFSEKIKTRPKGDWFRMNMLILEENNNRSAGGIYYLPKCEDYYAKLRLEGEWGINGIGTSGGGGDLYQYDYTVSLRAHFSSTDKLEKAKRERFENLLQKARLADYQVESQWIETVDTYGENGWRDILRLATDEKEFSDILDKWAQWKYDISENMSQEQASKIFRQICKQAKADSKYNAESRAGKAIELIYDKLDLEDLVKKYERVIKNKTRQNTPDSISVMRHAIELWDKKLNSENANIPNIIERRISPALLVWREDIEGSAALGGADIERYLQREYRRERRISGLELKSKNREYTLGMHLNKSLYHLAFMDSPAARQFRQKHKRQIMELTELIVGSNFNNSRKPPEFLFFDLDRGEKSLAYQYWPSYSVHVESSFPGWWYDKLKKRWTYLARLGPLATEDMYIHCWNISKDLQELMGGYLLRALQALPHDKIIPITKEIIKELQSVADQKRQKLGLDKNARHYFTEDECVDTAMEYLVQAGDKESLQLLLSKHGQGQNDFAIRRIKRFFQNENMPDYSLIEILARNENPMLRILPLEAIRRFPTANNRKILERLLSDSDEQVRNAAQQVAAELEEIKNTQVEELVSEPKGS